MMNLKSPLILASKSPRRQEILLQAGFTFEVKTKDTAEDFPVDMPAVEVARYLARKKAEAFQDELKDQILLTADTTVLIDDEILNKADSPAEATSMLRKLSGRSHLVVSGACLMYKGEFNCFDDTTEVYFRQLKEEEIQYYIQHYRPFDKAGSYGIQEWIGMVGVEKIVGSYFTVMGLPIHKVYQELLQIQQNPSL